MFLIQRLSVAVLAFCTFSMGMSQSQSSSDFWGKMLADAYELQMRRVQESLPPHSALPPLLDLRDAVQFFQRDPKFENKYKAAIFTKR